MLDNGDKLDFGHTKANAKHSPLFRREDVIDDALIAAQNALAGYIQLSNTPETEDHHRIAVDAFEQVREAIKQNGTLRRQGIVAR